jgi:hypothetical protein
MMVVDRDHYLSLTGPHELGHLNVLVERKTVRHYHADSVNSMASAAPDGKPVTQANWLASMA